MKNNSVVTPKAEVANFTVKRTVKTSDETKRDSGPSPSSSVKSEMKNAEDKAAVRDKPSASPITEALKSSKAFSLEVKKRTVQKQNSQEKLSEKALKGKDVVSVKPMSSVCSKAETLSAPKDSPPENDSRVTLEEGQLDNLNGEGADFEEIDDERDDYDEGNHDNDEQEYEPEEADADDAEEELVGEEEKDVDEEDDHEIELPASVHERTKKKEFEVFVGGLDKNVNEEELRKIFSKVGQVVQVRLVRVPMTSKNKGYGFIVYATQEEAKRAVKELKNVMIRGRRCGVAPSEDNDTLFLGNICNTWTKEAVRERLKFYRIEGVEEITLVGDSQNEGLSRGFAFLAFATHSDAMKAYKRLQRSDVVFGGTRTAKVAFAEPLREPDEEIMAQVKSVFVDGIPPHWDEDRVKIHLKEYGEIERVVLARNMATAKRRDFGFVNFDTHEAALACIRGLNDSVLVDGETRMRVRVRLANPLPKSQAVKGGMRGGFPLGRSGIGIHNRGWGVKPQGHPFKRQGVKRGRGLLSVLRGRGIGGREGRISSRDDNDVDNIFHSFREQLVRDERPPSASRRHDLNIDVEGDLRKDSYKSYTRPKSAIPSRSIRARSDEDIDVRPYRNRFTQRGGHLIRQVTQSHARERHTLPQRPSFPPVEDSMPRNIERRLGYHRLRDDTVAYDGSSQRTKRSYVMADDDPRFVEPVSREHIRPRYDYPTSSLSLGLNYEDQETYSSGYERFDEAGNRSIYSSRYKQPNDPHNEKPRNSSYSIYSSSRSAGGGSYY